MLWALCSSVNSELQKVKINFWIAYFFGQIERNKIIHVKRSFRSVRSIPTLSGSEEEPSPL